MSTLQDRLDVIDVVTRSFRAIDERDWATYEASMMPLVQDEIINVVGMSGDREMSATERTARTRAVMDPLHTSQHILTNHVVTIDGDTAKFDCYEQAIHYHPGLSHDPMVNSWIQYARVWRTLKRTPDGWRISTRRIENVFNIGNRNLLQDISPS